MHPQQRHARFNIIVISCSLLSALLGYALLFAFHGSRGAMAAFAFLGISSLLGLGDRFYRKGKNPSAVVMDERDEDIKRRAMVIGWGVDWLFWGLICMVPWFVVAFRSGFERSQELAIPVALLPLTFMATGLLHVLAWSIAVLVLYGRQGGGDAA